jgi:phosphoribosyl-ATP pyrophosphohydrolase
MILPSFDLGSPALADAMLRYPLDELAAIAALLPRVAVRDVTGANADVVVKLVKSKPGVFRVEGVKSVDEAVALLDAGAPVVVVDANILKADASWATLPTERVWAEIAAKPGENLLKLEAPVAAVAGGFHFVYPAEPDTAALAAFAKARGYHTVSCAGTITTGTQIGALDKIGVDARVSSPLFDGTLCFPDAVAGCLKTDRTDGLWSTVIVDENGVAVGFAYSDIESLRTAITQRVGAYHSRSRNSLWIKGATSGATQELLGIALDCDRDALRFTVRQKEPGFCHENTWSCWGATGGLPALSRLLTSRAKDAPVGSYTHRLLNDPALLASKLREEAGELIEASAQNDRKEVAAEAADVIYFTLVHLAKHGVSLSEVERVLDARHYKVTRRKGDAKPGK